MREKAEARLGEVLRFALTGGVCFLVEFAALVLLRDGLGLDTLAAVPIAFALSVVFNYVLCMRFVFRGARDGGSAAKAGFAVTSVMGSWVSPWDCCRPLMEIITSFFIKNRGLL